MKVKLRDFLRIVNRDETGTIFNRDSTVDSFTNIYIETYDEFWDDYNNKCIGEVREIKLADYLDYEVVDFVITTEYGEIDEINLTLRKDLTK